MELTDVTTVKRRFLYYTGVMLTLRFVTTETCKRVRELEKKKKRKVVGIQASQPEHGCTSGSAQHPPDQVCAVDMGSQIEKIQNLELSKVRLGTPVVLHSTPSSAFNSKS